MTDVPSLLMVAGRKHYKLHEYIAEAQDMGVSKRIPLKAIPEGMQKGLSKIFIGHPDAIVKTTNPDPSWNLQALAYDLMEAGILTEKQWNGLVELDQPYWTGVNLAPGDFVPESMLAVTIALSKVDHATYSRLVSDYGLEFCMGVIGYTHFEGFQVVLDDDEMDLPEDLEHLRPLVESGYVQPVHVSYLNDDGEPEETDDPLV